MVGMATSFSTTTVALCFDDYIFGIHFLDITGYGYIGPVCFEEYIFTPNAASHPHLRFKEYIFCIRFPDITGYGDIGPERFEDYIFVGYHCIDPGLLAEYISQ